MTDRVVIDPTIRHGQPVIRGTRVPVSRIVAELASNAPWERVQKDYGITADDIRAALDFARR